MLVVFWLVNLYSLFVYMEHKGDESPKDPSFWLEVAGKIVKGLSTNAWCLYAVDRKQSQVLCDGIDSMRALP